MSHSLLTTLTSSQFTMGTHPQHNIIYPNKKITQSNEIKENYFYATTALESSTITKKKKNPHKGRTSS